MDVISILFGLAVSLLLIELYAWLPSVAYWLLNVAVRKLPDEDRERCREEWTAGLNALPNTLVRLLHAASFIAAAEAIKANAQYDDIRFRFADLESENDQALLSTAELVSMRAEMREEHAKFLSWLAERDVRPVGLDRWLQHAEQQIDDLDAKHRQMTFHIRSASRYFARVPSGLDPVSLFAGLIILKFVSRDLQKARRVHIMEAARSTSAAIRQYLRVCGELERMHKGNQ